MDQVKARILIENMTAPDDDSYYNSRMALVKGGKESIPFLLEGLKHENTDAVSGCITALGELGAIEAVPLLIRRFTELAAKSWPNGWSDRSVIVHAMVKIGTKEIRPILQQVAESDEIESLRATAISYLTGAG